MSSPTPDSSQPPLLSPGYVFAKVKNAPSAPGMVKAQSTWASVGLGFTVTLHEKAFSFLLSFARQHSMREVYHRSKATAEIQEHPSQFTVSVLLLEKITKI